MQMTNRKHGNADGTFGINLYANTTYNRVTIQVSADFILGMKAGMRETLGFDNSQNALTNGEFNGINPAKIEKVNNVLIHCSLVNNQILYDSSISMPLYLTDRLDRYSAFLPTIHFGEILEMLVLIT